ncbi:MAG: ankyrin repeat domain-containing protein [Candidatus Babeliales bacterium]|jgi:Ankyrin repeats (3 copies)
MKYFFKNILLSLLIFKLAFSSLIMATKKGKQLRRAARKGDVAALTQLLCKSNVDVDEVNATNGRTALMYAAKNGHADAVKLLLSWNANAEQQDDKGFTALCHHIDSPISGFTGRTKETEEGKFLAEFRPYASIFHEEKYQKICGLLLLHYKGDFKHEKNLMLHRNGPEDTEKAVLFWQRCTEKYASIQNRKSLNIIYNNCEK